MAVRSDGVGAAEPAAVALAEKESVRVSAADALALTVPLSVTKSDAAGVGASESVAEADPDGERVSTEREGEKLAVTVAHDVSVGEDVCEPESDAVPDPEKLGVDDAAPERELVSVGDALCEIVGLTETVADADAEPDARTREALGHAVDESDAEWQPETDAEPE